jgi:ParB-like chromosome segregation protein Spo0J
MAEKQTEKEIVDMPVAKLKPHPLQAKIYRGRADWEVEELARNMSDHGQDEPVEVTPDLHIISGHGRVEAAKRLGWTTVRCWVRRDLEEAGREAVEARLIEANLVRRQLSKFDMARSYLHLKKMARDKRGNLLREDKVKGDMRDLLGKRFGASGRTLDRWLKVLELPLLLQQAVDEGTLKLTEAVKVAGLDKKAQQQIAKDVGAGMPATAAIARHLDPATYGHATAAQVTDGVAAGRALDRLLEALERAREELAPRVAQLMRFDAFGTVLPDLLEAKKLIGALIARIKQNQEDRRTP